jgi:hypothetical protein
MPDFTPAQLKHWEQYERVRQSGRFNMFFPQARDAAGLTREEHSFVMKNYDALKAAVEKAKET